MINNYRNTHYSKNKSFYQNGTKYRSVRYKISCSQNAVEKQTRKTHYTKASTPNFNSVKQKRIFRASLTKIKGFPIQQSYSPDQERFQSANCIQVFKDMINSEKNARMMISSKKQSRVYLPNLKDQNQSRFLTLDPVGWPINFIQKQIEKAKEILQKEKQTIKRSRQQILIFHTNQLRKIQQTKKEGEENLKRLRNLLIENKVNHQQTMLKIKKTLLQDKKFIMEYKQQFQGSQKRIICLQNTIYNGNPFQLKQGEQYQIISQKYF